MLNIQYQYKKELNFDSALVNTPSLIISINNQYEYEHLILILRTPS